MPNSLSKNRIIYRSKAITYAQKNIKKKAALKKGGLIQFLDLKNRLLCCSCATGLLTNIENNIIVEALFKRFTFNSLHTSSHSFSYFSIITYITGKTNNRSC